jgi:hypothetical protein
MMVEDESSQDDVESSLTSKDALTLAFENRGNTVTKEKVSCCHTTFDFFTCAKPTIPAKLWARSYTSRDGKVAPWAEKGSSIKIVRCPYSYFGEPHRWTYSPSGNSSKK